MKNPEILFVFEKGIEIKCGIEKITSVIVVQI